jgi:hypothetical protein
LFGNFICCFLLLVYFKLLTATEKNVHLSLVIHPRKEQDDTLLNINSVFGTAKATQEADNVLILQRVDGNKLIDIRKNRFDGDLGQFQIMFDPETHLYRDELSERGLAIGQFDDRVGRVDSGQYNMEDGIHGGEEDGVRVSEQDEDGANDEKKQQSLHKKDTQLDEIIMS